MRGLLLRAILLWGISASPILASLWAHLLSQVRPGCPDFLVLLTCHTDDSELQSCVQSIRGNPGHCPKCFDLFFRDDVLKLQLGCGTRALDYSHIGDEQEKLVNEYLEYVASGSTAKWEKFAAALTEFRMAGRVCLTVHHIC